MKNSSIDFGAVMQQADIWLNGKHLLTHTGGYLPFSIDISTFLNYDKSNQLIVRIAAEAGIATVLLQSGCVKKGMIK